MNNPNPKNIDIRTQEGLDLLNVKAMYYDHYAENLKVLELIQEIEILRLDTDESLYEARKKLGW